MEIPTLEPRKAQSMNDYQRYYRAACVELDESGTFEDWPQHFSFPPRAGELVKSNTGKIAKIANVVHIAGATGPIVILELSRDTGGSTPVEGSGAALE